MTPVKLDELTSFCVKNKLKQKSLGYMDYRLKFYFPEVN